MALFTAKWHSFFGKNVTFCPSIYIKYNHTSFINYSKVIRVGFESQGAQNSPKWPYLRQNGPFSANILRFALTPPPSKYIKYVHTSFKTILSPKWPFLQQNCTFFLQKLYFLPPLHHISLIYFFMVI